MVTQSEVDADSTGVNDVESLDLVRSIEGLQLFNNLSSAQLSKILSRFSTRLYHPEELICVQGSATEELHILVSGQLAVVDEEGMRLATILPVEAVGELGIISGQPRAASVAAVKPSIVLIIDRQAFDTVLREEPDIQVKLYENIIRSLCNKIVNENVRLRDAESAAGRHQDEVIELERKVVAAIELLAKEGISRDRAESLIVEKTRSRLRERVLVVDDEPVIRRVIAKGLRPLNVIEADNGRDALMKMKTERASLVITDIKMPELDGFELLANLRRQYPQIPVIAISGYTDVAEIQSHGFDAFLEKPVNLEVLKSLVNDIFVSRES